MATTKYELLSSIVREILMDRQATARELLADLVDYHLDPDTDPDDLQCYLFASALAKRLQLNQTTAMNLYLRKFELPQIALFNLLATKLPPVALAGQIANEVLVQLCNEDDEIVLLDIGIGTGRQEVALLHRLVATRRVPRRLTIVAVEPCADSLCQAQRAVESTAKDLRINLVFHPINKVAEELGDKDWNLCARMRGTHIMHGAFAAHHMRDRGDGSCARDAFFQELRQFDPVAVVLCEPNSDHRTASLEERLTNAWHHFGLVFQLINRLAIPQHEKQGMKMFFAREIEDILGNAEESRYERHEPISTWVQRLRSTGYTPSSHVACLPANHGDTIVITPHDQYIGLDYNNETLVAILYATCVTASNQPVGDDQAPSEAISSYETAVLV